MTTNLKWDNEDLSYAGRYVDPDIVKERNFYKTRMKELHGRIPNGKTK